MNRVWTLVVAALVVNAMVIGATWDQTIKQLPARQVIGAEAFSAYSKAGDPATLTQIFDQFEQLNLLRAPLQPLSSPLSPGPCSPPGTPPTTRHTHSREPRTANRGPRVHDHSRDRSRRTPRTDQTRRKTRLDHRRPTHPPTSNSP